LPDRVGEPPGDVDGRGVGVVPLVYFGVLFGAIVVFARTCDFPWLLLVGQVDILLAPTLAAPGLVATAIFAAIVTFTEFLVALVLTSTPDAETVPRGVSTLVGRIDTDWPR